MEYKDWRNFKKVIDKAIISANNSIHGNEYWVLEANKPIKKENENKNLEMKQELRSNLNKKIDK